MNHTTCTMHSSSIMTGSVSAGEAAAAQVQARRAGWDRVGVHGCEYCMQLSAFCFAKAARGCEGPKQHSCTRVRQLQAKVGTAADAPEAMCHRRLNSTSSGMLLCCLCCQ